MAPLTKFQKIYESAILIDALKLFLEKNKLGEKYQIVFSTIKDFTVYTIVNSWMKLSEQDRDKNILLLLNVLDDRDLCLAFARLADEAIEGATQAHGYRVAIDEMRESNSYKIGLKMTAIPRAVKKALKKASGKTSA
jgi:hypothetical protein